MGKGGLVSQGGPILIAEAHNRSLMALLIPPGTENPALHHIIFNREAFIINHTKHDKQNDRLWNTSRLLKSFILLISFVLSSVAAMSDDLSHLEVMTEEYPPYNYQENGELKGLAVELLGASIQNIPEFPEFEMKIFPWPRAYQTLLHSPDTMLFSMTRTPEREPLFKWAGPIASTRIVLLAKKDSHIKIDSANDLSQYVIGAIQDDIGDQSLRKIKNSLNILYPNSVDSLLKMLDANRIQLLAYEQNVLNWFLTEQQYDLTQFEQVFLLEESQLYYAFNQSVSDALVAKIQAAIDQIKTNTTAQGANVYDAMVSKYLGHPGQK